MKMFKLLHLLAIADIASAQFSGNSEGGGCNEAVLQVDPA
jgi:hypothetical protein